MIPVVLIPLLVQATTRLIKYAFDQLEKAPEEKKNKALDKMEANDRKAALKQQKKEYEENEW